MKTRRQCDIPRGKVYCRGTTCFPGSPVEGHTSCHYMHVQCRHWRVAWSEQKAQSELGLLPTAYVLASLGLRGLGTSMRVARALLSLLAHLWRIFHIPQVLMWPTVPTPLKDILAPELRIALGRREAVSKMVCYSNWQVVDSPGLYSVCRAGWYVRETLLVCMVQTCGHLQFRVWYGLLLTLFLTCCSSRTTGSYASLRAPCRPPEAAPTPP